MRVTQPNRGANAQAVPQQCTFKSDYNVYISSASRNNAHWTNCSTFHRLQASCAKSQLRGGGERSDEDQGLLQMKISLSTITLVFLHHSFSLPNTIWFGQIKKTNVTAFYLDALKFDLSISYFFASNLFWSLSNLFVVSWVWLIYAIFLFHLRSKIE